MQLADKLPERIEQACIKGLRAAALRGVGEVVRQIDHADPFPAVDSGSLRQSVLAKPIPEGAELSVNSPQGAWMEFGTRPHMPPIKPILVWVTRKFGLSERQKAKRKFGPYNPKFGPKKPPKQGPKMAPKYGPKRSRQNRNDANAAKAYAIAKKVQWKIYHHGTAPRGFFSKAMVVITSKYAPREVRHELKQLEKHLI